MNNVLSNIIAKNTLLSVSFSPGTDDVGEILERIKRRKERSQKMRYWFYDDFGDFSNDTYLYDSTTYF